MLWDNKTHQLTKFDNHLPNNININTRTNYKTPQVGHCYLDLRIWRDEDSCIVISQIVFCFYVELWIYFQRSKYWGSRFSQFGTYTSWGCFHIIITHCSIVVLNCKKKYFKTFSLFISFLNRNLFLGPSIGPGVTVLRAFIQILAFLE